MSVCSCDGRSTRRAWLAHCTALLARPPALPPMPSLGAARRPAPQKILVVGDSLSAEYGLERGSGWVALLEQRLAREQHRARPSSTRASAATPPSGGRARLPALLRSTSPTLVILELGGNDALRGLPLEDDARQPRRDGAGRQGRRRRVLILGMQLPPNYGRSYGDDFAAHVRRRRAQRRRGAGAVPAEGRRRHPAGRADVPGRPHPPARERAPDASSPTSGRCSSRCCSAASRDARRDRAERRVAAWASSRGSCAAVSARLRPRVRLRPA